MNKEKALKNQGLEFREDIILSGGVLPELVISAETGTAARRESPRIMPENQVFKLRNFIIQSSLRFIICP